jgi:hypothetical protein
MLYQHYWNRNFRKSNESFNLYYNQAILYFIFNIVNGIMKFLAPLTLLFLLCSSNTFAAYIYSEYQGVPNTNIATSTPDENVIVGNLEWMNFEKTKGLSISEALTQFSDQGWRLASSPEVSDLLNSFFGLSVFDSDESSRVDVFSSSSGSIFDSAINIFLSLFGTTDLRDYCWENHVDRECVDGNTLNGTLFFYGSDADADQLYEQIWLRDESTVINFNDSSNFFYQPLVNQYSDEIPYEYSRSIVGIALVRSTQVQAPTTLAIFAIGILWLVLRKQKKS